MTYDHGRTPLNCADELRTQLNKIAKLVTYLEDNDDEETRANAARAVVVASSSMRRSLYTLENQAHHVLIEEQERHTSRLDRFFGPTQDRE
jgi:esterase/lipase